MNEANARIDGPGPGLAQRIVFGRNPAWTLFRIALWAALILGISRFALVPVKIQGPSMMPTYKEGGVNLINRLAYMRKEPQRGDVVAIRYAGMHIMLLKRVIGLPGETVRFAGGQVYINGKLLPEPYLKYPSKWTLDEVKLEPGEYFVVGDNRSMSARDHEFGRAKRQRIIGRAVFGSPQGRFVR